MAAGLVLLAAPFDTSGASGTGIAGVYDLIAVNGSAVPATVSHGPVELEVGSGTFTIKPGGTCRSEVRFGKAGGAEILREVNATYTREAATLRMQWEGAGTTSGTIEGDRFEMNNEGLVFTYRKQAPPGRQVLDRFLGSWRTDYTLPKAEWTPVELSGSADLMFRRVLGGRFIQEQATHADGKEGSVMYTYEEAQNRYRAWWFSSTGDTSESSGEWDGDSKTLTWTAVQGAEAGFTTTSSHHFLDDRHFEWSVAVRDRAGTVLFRMDGKAVRSDADHAWARPVTLDGVPNLHQVSAALYRSAQPAGEGMQNLEQTGIKTVVNLRSFHSDRDDIGDTGLGYEHIYMKAWHPEREEVVRFLQIVTDPGRTPVLVHCQHGADRTGTMCALYRIAVEGWSKQRAIQEMTEGGFGFHAVWQNLPDWVEDLDIPSIRQEAGLAEDAASPR